MCQASGYRINLKKEPATRKNIYHRAQLRIEFEKCYEEINRDFRNLKTYLNWVAYQIMTMRWQQMTN